MQNPEIIIKVKGLSKKYKLYQKPIDRLKETLHPLRRQYHREFLALTGIDMEIKRGAAVGIIGKNGSGKSTLLKILTGILTPTEGEVFVKGRVAALLELGAGFNPELTGIENIFLNGSLMGYSKEEIQSQLDSIISFADIGEFIFQPVKMYSSGMFARLAFSVAINVEPDILIIDEALSVGDVFFQAKAFEKIREFKKKNKTVIFVSHDASQVSLNCEIVFLLDKGSLIAAGAPDFVLSEYRKVVSGISGSSNVSVSEDLKEHQPKDSYGNGDAVIQSVSIKSKDNITVSSLEVGSSYYLDALIHSNEAVQDCIFGFSLRLPNGFEAFGTNSFLESNKMYSLEPGEQLKVRFDFVVPVNPCQLILNVGLVTYKNGDLVVLHRFYNLQELVVVGTSCGTGAARLESSFSIG